MGAAERPQAGAAPPAPPAPNRRRGAALEQAILRAAASELSESGYAGMTMDRVARGEALPEALHPRVATVAIALLRNEYVTRGHPTVPDGVLVEIVDQVYLPLVRGRAGSASATAPVTDGAAVEPASPG